MRWLCLVAFSCASIILCAQEKEVRLSEKGVTTNVSKDDIATFGTTRAVKLKDSIYQAQRNRPDSLLRKGRLLSDSITNIAHTINGQRVYSQKQWRQFYDSLNKLPFANVPELQQMLKSEVDEGELVDLVNKKFSTSKGDSILTNASKEYQDGINKVEEGKNEVKSLEKKIPSTDLARLKLPEYSLQDLSPLLGRILKSKYIEQLDSIRKINLRDQGMELSEKRISAEEKISAFTKKPNFWDKSYFEGVIGFAPGDLTLIQASPTVGYHFSDFLSLGVGPNVLIKEEEKKVVTTVGLKTFFKAEFFKRQGYFQLEDIMDTYGVKSDAENTKSFYEQHNIFVGGGWLLSLSAPLTLNFSILYCVNKSEVVGHEFSPMVFRIGISSIKVKK